MRGEWKDNDYFHPEVKGKPAAFIEGPDLDGRWDIIVMIGPTDESRPCYIPSQPTREKAKAWAEKKIDHLMRYKK